MAARVDTVGGAVTGAPLNPREAAGLVGRAIFVDVREPYEFAAGHIEGSIPIPMTQIPERWEELASEDQVVVVCHLGQRSAVVVDFLRHRGIQAQNLEGGLEEWARQGLDLTPPDLGGPG
ncbi:MAG TPA: rhodanese-like domain-containing protein [Actinomycetota bacterium]|nr:rhodanese-like domain-containing protein [Actinomycetota bacterium]